MKKEHFFGRERFMRSVVLLDGYLGYKLRYWLSKFFAGIALVLLTMTIAIRLSGTVLPTIFVGPLGIILSLLGKVPGVDISNTAIRTVALLPGGSFLSLHLSGALGAWNGLLLSAIAFYVVVKMLNAFARSSYYSRYAAGERKETEAMSYDVYAMVARAKLGDLLQSFFADKLGIAILTRAGITQSMIVEYVGSRADITDYRAQHLLDKVFTLSDLTRLIVHDKSFSDWLNENAIDADDIVAAAEWVESDDSTFRIKERYWGKAAFSLLPRIGEDLAYGQAFQLQRYASEIIVQPAEFGQQYGGVDVFRLEQSLSREKGANALLVAPAPHIAEEVVADFARDIVYHFKHPFLADKRCFLFDVQYFCKDMSDPANFEQALSNIIEDAARAGNIIFIISDLPALYVRARQIGADVAGVLRPYLSSDVLQIISISDTAQYHEILAPQALLAEYLHDIHITEPEHEALLVQLEELAERIESQHDVFFTVPSLKQVIRDAERTLVHGLLIDRAREILEGMPAFLELQKVTLVLKGHVDAYVSQISNIPIGKASAQEQQQLLQIEELLHGSVIGQDIAIKSISDALRRSRAGVRNEQRPVASFLFFGPTGVGKTEVAKTLARVFFGGEDKLLRFDMSEFSDESALARLIGTIDGGVGALAPVIREHPYGVVLLDEFEKADTAVHDLFLQILDEGIFHDAQGRVVNCRNAIIIATSNAGAPHIFEHLKKDGVFDAEFAHKVTQEIITEGRFRPELLNRFDGVILFTPIDENGYRKIARLMLEKLAARLREQGIILVVNQDLISVIMEHGVDPVFGARPMQRAIQDIVEKKVAEKILQGKAGPGVPLEFTRDELES